MANRFYTILIVPEKTAQVRKIIVPSWILKGAAVGFSFVLLIGLIMVLDYWYVMNQIGENKTLKMENRRLKQQVQIFQNKMASIESTMERVKTFATRLKVITNIEDRGNLLQSLNSPNYKLPEAATNIGSNGSGGQTPPATAPSAGPVLTSANELINSGAATSTPAPSASPTGPLALLDAGSDGTNPEEYVLHKEQEQLDQRFSLMSQESLYVEQQLQDLYELLADKRDFLAARPTRKPAIGYFTSGFGIRRSPYGGRVKMHEGLDIANRPGTLIKAPADGLVTFADTKSGYGQTLILDHGYGLETWYAHTRKILVSKGQKVRRGESIAQLGNSGRSTGPHLHYEVRVRGTPVNPLDYILEN